MPRQELLESQDGLSIELVHESPAHEMVSLGVDEEFLENVQSVYLVTHEVSLFSVLFLTDTAFLGFTLNIFIGYVLYSFLLCIAVMIAVNPAKLRAIPDLSLVAQAQKVSFHKPHEDGLDENYFCNCPEEVIVTGFALFAGEHHFSAPVSTLTLRALETSVSLSARAHGLPRDLSDASVLLLTREEYIVILVKSVESVLRHYVTASIAQGILRAEITLACCLLRDKIVRSDLAGRARQVFPEVLTVSAFLNIDDKVLRVFYEIHLILLLSLV